MSAPAAVSVAESSTPIQPELIRRRVGDCAPRDDGEQAIIDNRRIVWMRAEGHRWKQICRAVGCVRSTAWRRWTAALVTIANRLNKQRKTSRRPHSAKTSGDARGAKRDGWTFVAEGEARCRKCSKQLTKGGGSDDHQR